MGLFDDDFNMEEYLKKRMLQMDNLKNREIFKEVIQDMMMNFYAHAREEYQGLQKRVFDEAPRAVRLPDIVTGICAREEYDLPDKYLFPMRAEDLERTEVEVSEMLAARAANKPFFMYTCFFEEDAGELQKLLASGRTFRGVIQNEFSETPASFTIRLNRHYLELIEELYPIAQLNQLPWRSMLTPYLYKLVDVYVTDIEEWDDELEVRQVKVDFEEYADKVRYDMVPLWNVNSVMVRANAYPQPAMERSFYEHYLYQSQFQKGCRYLLREANGEVRAVRWQADDLYILCDDSMPQDWNFYEVHESVQKAPSQYPLFSNAQKDTFSRSMREAFGERIKTRTELVRFLESFVCSSHLQFRDAAVLTEARTVDTYETEQFIAHEFRTGDGRQQLRLDFWPVERDSFLNRDIASFLTAGVQHFFPEYTCIGRLV